VPPRWRSVFVSLSPLLQVFFGSLRPGLQIHTTCRLWLVRDTRRGDKSHDEQRRLERFREQRPGG
jgi:hypothetical protein